MRTKSSPYLLAVIFAATIACAKDPQQKELLFHASFDGVTKAAFAKGSPEAITTGKIEFVKGLKGQALVIDQDNLGCAFATQGNLEAKEGTIEVLLMAIDWFKDDGLTGWFFRAGREYKSNALSAYRIATGTLCFYISNKDPFVETYSTVRMKTTWVPDQWHHVIGTWDARGVRSCVDGVLSPVKDTFTDFREGAQPEDLGEEMFLGAYPDLPPNDPQCHQPGKTAMDELRIWSRAFNETEMRARYEKFEKLVD